MVRFLTKRSTSHGDMRGGDQFTLTETCGSRMLMKKKERLLFLFSSSRNRNSRGVSNTEPVGTSRWTSNERIFKLDLKRFCMKNRAGLVRAYKPALSHHEIFSCLLNLLNFQMFLKDFFQWRVTLREVRERAVWRWCGSSSDATTFFVMLFVNG